MYECTMVELTDYNLNHLVNHYDEDVQEIIEYAQEHGAIAMHAEYDGTIYWDEHRN
ncbi:MAG: hypothetical protein PHW64_07415 [Sulfuricurvum sp.]|nr:hypothetical protein [Sulfuricurvum sp.]